MLKKACPNATTTNFFGGRATSIAVFDIFLIARFYFILHPFSLVFYRGMRKKFFPKEKIFFVILYSHFYLNESPKKKTLKLSFYSYDR